MIRCILAALLLVAAQAQAAITYIAGSTAESSSATSVGCGEPAGVAQGDVLLALVNMTEDTMGGTWDAPNGFTDVDNDFTSAGAWGTNDNVISVLYQVRGASTIGTTTFTYSGSAGLTRCTIIAFRGANTASPFDVTFSAGSHRTTGVNDLWNTASPAITTVTDGAMGVLLTTSTGGSATAVAPTNYTLGQSGIASNRSHATAYRLITSAGTETPGAWAMTGQGAAADAYYVTLALKPASGLAAQRRRR